MKEQDINEMPHPTVDEMAEKEQQFKRQNRLSVSDLKEMGFVIVLISGFNRAVNKKHVEELMSSVKLIGRFLSPIMVISGQEYFQQYPDRSITKSGDIVINAEFPELYRVLIVVDGQHRYTADQELGIDENYVSTLEAEYLTLPDGVSPDEWITTINTTSKNWDSKDRTSYINATVDNEHTNIAIMEQLQKDYGIGDRYAMAILNFADNYKKSLQVNYMAHPENGLPSILEGTLENQKRGLDTLHAMEVGYRASKKAFRKMTTIKFVIEVYNATPDAKKEKTVQNLQMFLKTLDSQIVSTVAKSGQEYAGITMLKDGWSKFCKKISSENGYRAYEKKALEAEQEWAKMMEAKKTKQLIRAVAKSAAL